MTPQLLSVFDAASALDVALAVGAPDLPRQTLRARLLIFDESLLLTKYDDHQAVTTYEVNPDDLVAAFGDAPLTTGLLPRNCLFFQRANGALRLGIYVPPQVRTVAVVLAGETRATALRIPLPGLVWVGCGREYHLFAVKQPPYQATERLFVAPFPNVYSDGRICPGDVSFPVCAIETVQPALNMFLVSRFNGDLRGGSSQAHHEDVRVLWQELHAALSAGEEGADRWPLDDLVRTSMVLGDLVQGGA